RPSYIVSPTDNLVEIAEKFFNDSSLAWLIADINVGRITEHLEDGKRIIELRSRQEIELPLASEIKEFLLRKNKEAKAENMVTIVSVSEIDRELLDSFLSNVVGGPVLPPVQIGSASEAMAAYATEEEESLFDEAPLMSLVNLGKQLSKSLMPTMSALLQSGHNLKTYISKIDAVSSRNNPALKPEPQR
ncbi:MAG: hypothetical protein K2X27_04890, partial [Candidatus Obscuribacterales bacterium]|nr:hypothetical protein [Candidatus Obscuribacterales bacterium]